MKAVLNNRVLVIFCRLFLAAIFIFFAVGKIRTPGVFAKDIFQYEVLHPVTVNAVAIYLPWVELVTGLLLLVGVWKRGASFLATSMLMTFLGALGFNLLRGRDLHCGCGGTWKAPENPIAAWLLDFFVTSPDMMITIYRDLVLLAMALIVLFSPVVWRKVSTV